MNLIQELRQRRVLQITGAYVLGGWADFIRGDATAAYTTYSKLNNSGNPFSFSNWSWGYFGANPVLHARRDVIAVQPCDGLPAWVCIGDDIDKDGASHDYQWRLHTADVNTVDTSGVETLITATTGRMIIHAINPPRSALTAGVAPYNNLTSEPDSVVWSQLAPPSHEAQSSAPEDPSAEANR